MQNSRYVGMGVGIFLVGLVLTLVLPGVGIWPWILVVIGLAILPPTLAAKRYVEAWTGFLWMIGMALLVQWGFLWAGILALIGLGAVLLRSNAKASSEREERRTDEG